MRRDKRISVIIPALNEELSIAQVIQAVPAWADEVIVADNGSTDSTVNAARNAGARVIIELRRGYGQACLAGIAALSAPDIVVFLDGDFSDYPEEMDRLVDPIIRNEADMMIGSRVLGCRERGALTPQARFGNRLSCLLIRLFWKVHYTDLGPFRAIRFSTLQQLRMEDTGFGWTVEMQVKAAKASIPASETAVSYRRRIGVSKISGTVRGVILAGTKILYTILRAALQPSYGRFIGPERKLIVFTRFPVSGEAKTRLIPALGAEGAAALQRQMTEHTVRQARKTGAQIEIRYTGGTETKMRGWLGNDLHYTEQGGGDLGERMTRAFQAHFSAGATRVVVIGCDCPSNHWKNIRKGFQRLETSDCVIGPATDGGYYLIGLRRFIPELFRDIAWGTEQVLKQTLAAAPGKPKLLPELGDVDLPDDVPQKISVIIPTLNEAETILPTLGKALEGFNIECIVADGGSTDDTVRLPQEAGAKVVSAAQGRAVQMNAGAASASGTIVLFLHADTELPDNWDFLIRAALKNPQIALGAFRFRIKERLRGIAAVEWGTNLRSRLFRMPYGDQGLFLRRETFDRIGGFPEQPILEDAELVCRARQFGKIITLPEAAITSGRRWRRLGVFRTTFRNQLILLGAVLRISPQQLRSFYDRASKRQKI